MTRQKPWVQLGLLPCTAIAFLFFPFCCHASNTWQWNSNPVIGNALKAHGMTDTETTKEEEGLIINPCLEYPIFHGKSALWSLPDSCHEMIQRELSSLSSSSSSSDDDNDVGKKKKKEKVALLLMLAGYGDAAHDVLLGTTLDNLQEAEYAATHRGQTNWAGEHPLSDLDDVLHSLIHRIYEGSTHGEGGYTGYENAQYWCAGGPKKYEAPIAAAKAEWNNYEATTPTTGVLLLAKVYQELCQLALKHTPICVSRGIIAQAPAVEAVPIIDKTSTLTKQQLAKESDQHKRSCRGVSHSIIAGGGKFRDVFVPEGCWDPIAFCQLLLLLENDDDDDDEMNNGGKEDTTNANTNRRLLLQQELEYLTEKELELLAKHLLLSSSSF